MQTLAGDVGLGWSQVFILLLPFLLAVSFWAASDPQLEVMALAGVGTGSHIALSLVPGMVPSPCL